MDIGLLWYKPMRKPLDRDFVFVSTHYKVVVGFAVLASFPDPADVFQMSGFATWESANQRQKTEFDGVWILTDRITQTASA